MVAAPQGFQSLKCHLVESGSLKIHAGLLMQYDTSINKTVTAMLPPKANAFSVLK